jgi:hypothetical protein
MALTDTSDVLGKTITRAYVLERLKKGYLIKDIVREWAKDNNFNIFGGTYEKVPKARSQIRGAVQRFIYGYTRANYTLKSGEVKRYAGRPPDKELVDLITKNKKNILPATVLKQFNKFISDNKAKYVGKKGGTENLYADAVKWFKKNNPAAIMSYGEAGFGGKGVKLRPGQEIIMIKGGEGATVASLEGGRESIRKLVSPAKKMRSPLRYDRVKEAWTKAAESLGMTYNEYQNMISKNMTYPIKKLFPQLMDTKYAAGPEHMYGLRQAISTGLLSEIRKAAKAVVPAPKAFNSLIKGPQLDLQVTGLLDNAFNTNDLAKRRDIIKTVNEKIAKFKSEYPGTYPKYVVDKVGNIKDVNIKNISMVKRPVITQAREYIDYLNKTPGFKESKEFARLPEATQTIFQSRAEKLPQFHNQLRQLVLTAAKTNKGGVCNIFRAEGGRIGFAAGSSCVAQMETALRTDPIKTTEQISRLPGNKTINSLKTATGGFLKMLGRGGAKVAPYAALAAAGAAAEPLVKQFVIDDPNTYLTNENQQKGMLLSLLEREPPKVDEEILKWQMPALGAATAAGAIPGAGAVYKARRSGVPLDKSIGPLKEVGKTRSALGISGVLGKALGASFSPLAVAATLPISVAAEREGGTEWGDIATDPSHWMGPAFAASGAEMASKGIKNPLLLKALRLGMSPRALMLGSRFLGLPGLALTAGMWGYDKWKKSKDDDEFKVRRYRDDDED